MYLIDKVFSNEQHTEMKNETTYFKDIVENVINYLYTKNNKKILENNLQYINQEIAKQIYHTIQSLNEKTSIPQLEDHNRNSTKICDYLLNITSHLSDIHICKIINTIYNIKVEIQNILHNRKYEIHLNQFINFADNLIFKLVYQSKITEKYIESISTIENNTTLYLQMLEVKTKELKTIQTDIRRLKDKLEKTEIELINTKEELKKQTTELEFQNNNYKITQELRTQKTSTEEQEKTINNLKEELENLKKIKNHDITALSNKIDRLESENKKLQEQLNTSSKTITNKDDQIKNLNEQIKSPEENNTSQNINQEIINKNTNIKNLKITIGILIAIIFILAVIIILPIKQRSIKSTTSNVNIHNTITDNLNQPNNLHLETNIDESQIYRDQIEVKS